MTRRYLGPPEDAIERVPVDLSEVEPAPIPARRTGPLETVILPGPRYNRFRGFMGSPVGVILSTTIIMTGTALIIFKLVVWLA